MTPIAKFWATLAAIGIVVSLVLGGYAYVTHLQRALTASKAGEATQTAVAGVATGQTAATADAAAIADRGAQRAARLAATHEEHAHALQAAPGAGQPLDPGFVRSLNDGLCHYDAYAADPGCAGLRGGDPAKLPGAGQADPPT